MSRMKSDSTGQLAAAIYSITLATALQYAFSKGRASWLKRRAIENDQLTGDVRRISNSRRIKVFILDRGGILEAFAYPTGEIFITKDLNELLDYKEALAVAIHEAGHVVYQSQTLSNIGRNGVLLTLIGNGASPVVSMAASFLSGMTITAWHERLADSFAVRQGYGPALSSALDKLYKGTDPFPRTLLNMPALALEKMDALFHIHPEIQHRIKSLALT